jgi:site-specific recombinase XerD
MSRPKRRNDKVIDFDGFRNYLYEEELSKNTIIAYLTGLQRYSEQYDEITKPNLIAFKQSLIKKGLKPKTVNNRITAILQYCKFKEIPMRVKQIKEQRKTYIDNVITSEQVERLLKGLKADGNIVWYFNILLLSKTGMRISEARRITKKDIQKGSVTIPAKAHMRTIYFPKSLVDEMQEYLSTLGDDELVLRTIHSKGVSKEAVNGRLKIFAEKYHIPREVMHAHSFRHFFAIEFLKRKNDIALLADILGHGSVNVTQIYLRQSQEQQKDAVDKAVDW